jgi:hypothetical protein
MSDELFNFIFGFLVATLLFWFLPLMWRKVIPARIKQVMPFGNKGGSGGDGGEGDENDIEVTEDVEEAEEKPKRQGNYKGRPKGAKNLPKAGPAPAGKKKQVGGTVNDFVAPERSQAQIDILNR